MVVCMRLKMLWLYCRSGDFREFAFSNFGLFHVVKNSRIFIFSLISL